MTRIRASCTLTDVSSTDIARICILGAESSGKTTLTRALAESYRTVWNPEYGRPYTELGRLADATWTSWEFTHIARMQCWYEDFLATLANRVLFCDTDAFTTSVFHEVYLGCGSRELDELARRPYALYLVCGLDVPWERDEIREFAEQRQLMHGRYVEYARASGSPWALLAGSRERRLADARAQVDALLAGT